MLLLQLGGKLEQGFEFAARHHDVFVQFGEAGIAQRVGKLPANLPDGFAFDGAKAALDE